MGFARPLRCALSASRLTRRAPSICRSFHGTLSARAANKPPSETPSSLSSPKQNASTARQSMKPYTAEQQQELAQKYNAEQMAAIEAGDAAIDPDDFYDQGVLRKDAMMIDYVDDFSKIRAYVDQPPRAAYTNYDPDWELKDEEDLAKDLTDWATSSEGEGEKDFREFAKTVSFSKGKPGTELDALSYIQPPLPPLKDPLIRRMVRESGAATGTQREVWLRQLSKRVGMDPRSLSTLRVKLLVRNRVANQTRMGKIGKHYVLVAAGNRKGLLGIGEGNAAELSHAVDKARRRAIRNMVPIPMYERRTIFGDVKGKVGATELELFTRPPGFGIRCQEKILEMCKCAGISDIAARVTRARNPMNTCKAAMQALLSQRDPEQVARARGRKMVDVRKVYYAGMT